MASKVTEPRTKMLVLRTLSLTNHWKLETWGKDMNLGKEQAAEKILHDFLKKVKLDIEGQ